MRVARIDGEAKAVGAIQSGCGTDICFCSPLPASLNPVRVATTVRMAEVIERWGVGVVITRAFANRINARSHSSENSRGGREVKAQDWEAARFPFPACHPERSEGSEPLPTRSFAALRMTRWNQNDKT